MNIGLFKSYIKHQAMVNEYEMKKMLLIWHTTVCLKSHIAFDWDVFLIVLRAYNGCFKIKI